MPRAELRTAAFVPMHATQLGQDNGGNLGDADEGQQVKRARFMQVEQRAGVGDEAFHLPGGFSRNAQATSSNC